MEKYIKNDSTSSYAKNWIRILSSLALFLIQTRKKVLNLPNKNKIYL